MVAFNYRPKFVDIRVNPPAEGERARETSERACDHVGCAKPGGHRAPKTRGAGNSQFWFFCQEHASEYNRRWDYFKDMSDAEIAAHNKAEEVGHRPVWNFRPGKGDRVSAAKFWAQAKPGDAFGLFGGGKEARTAAPAKKKVGRVQALALDVMALEEGADATAIRLRYAELVKRYHPDSNGGDRSAEQQLQKVIRAFKTLKAAGMV